MKKISILGSTGSIGTQALDVIGDVTSKAEVVCLTANKNTKRLEEQIRKYRPKFAAIGDESLYSDLKTRCADLDVKLSAGSEGIIEAATFPEATTWLVYELSTYLFFKDAKKSESILLILT